MKRTHIVFLALFLILSLGYTNCSVRHMNAATVLTSAQCKAELFAKPLLNVSASVCEDAANYMCERRVFKPGVLNGEFEENVCVDLAGSNDHVCILSRVKNFDTEGSRGSADDARDFAPGGAYNRDEVQCSNQKVTENNMSIVAAESDSVASALSIAMKSCRDRRAP